MSNAHAPCVWVWCWCVCACCTHCADSLKSARKRRSRAAFGWALCMRPQESASERARLSLHTTRAHGGADWSLRSHIHTQQSGGLSMIDLSVGNVCKISVLCVCEWAFLYVCTWCERKITKCTWKSYKRHYIHTLFIQTHGLTHMHLTWQHKHNTI